MGKEKVRSGRICWAAALGFAAATAWLSASSEAAEYEISTPLVLHGASPAMPADATDGAEYTLIGSVTGIGDVIFVDGFEDIVAWDLEFPPQVLLTDNYQTLASVEIPPGRYVAFARLQGITGSDPNPGNNYRFDCYLGPSFEFPVYRVGEEPFVERYLTYQGAATFDSSDQISFVCARGNGHELTAIGGKLTVIRTGN